MRSRFPLLIVVVALVVVALVGGACGSGSGPERPTVDPGWTVPSTTPPSTTPPSTTPPSTTATTSSEASNTTSAELVTTTTVPTDFCPDLASHLEREGGRLADIRSSLGPGDPQVYLEAASAMTLMAGWLAERVPQKVAGDAERLAALWREATAVVGSDDGQQDAAEAVTRINAALEERRGALSAVAETVSVHLLGECPPEVVRLLAALDPRTGVRPTTTAPPSTIPQELLDFIRKLLTGN